MVLLHHEEEVLLLNERVELLQRKNESDQELIKGFNEQVEMLEEI